MVGKFFCQIDDLEACKKLNEAGVKAKMDIVNCAEQLAEKKCLATRQPASKLVQSVSTLPLEISRPKAGPTFPVGTRIHADKDFSPLYTNEAMQSADDSGRSIIDLCDNSGYIDDETSAVLRSIFGISPYASEEGSSLAKKNWLRDPTWWTCISKWCLTYR